MRGPLHDSEPLRIAERPPHPRRVLVFRSARGPLPASGARCAGCPTDLAMARAACKIQQICKRLPRRTELAFGFNTPPKRPLERNKRNYKQEQAQQQGETSGRTPEPQRPCEPPNKTPGGTSPAGRKSRVSISRILRFP